MNQTVNLIEALLGLAAQYGPKLVKDVADLIHQDPNATLEQINGKITEALNEAARNDANVESS